MRYQYKMGGMWAELIEGALKGAKGAYDEDKEKKKKATEDKIATADKGPQQKDQGKQGEKPGIVDRIVAPIVAPIKDAAKQQATNDIAKWALIYLGLWLLLKGK